MTGGTGDVNPQWMTIGITIPAPGNVQRIVPVPIARLPEHNGRAIVMEILKIFWDSGHQVLAATEAAGSSQRTAALLLSTNSSPFNIASNADYNSVKVSGTLIDYYEDSQYAVWSGTSGNAGYSELFRDPTVHDLTDGQGHGVLVATDQMFLTGLCSTISNNANTTPLSGVCRILYRFKEIGLTEYIGIVQSQSQAGSGF